MSSQPLQPGTRIGKYELVAHVAAGGMGSVYKAHDLELGRTVALKVLPPQLADQPHVVERFRREARHAARLSHKNIVTLYEFGQADGQWFLAMEFVDGIDLESYIVRKGQVTPDEARRFLKQAARALDHAYRMGITHRDIKPANFLLTREEGRAVVKLTDFGLARAEGEQQFRLTRDGSTVGTVDYLAPEQARDSDSADVRSDIYSLGCACYHMLAGKPPFAEGGLGERVYKHLEAEPPDIRLVNPRVTDALWAVLCKMLAKKPEDRYQTPAELLAALTAPARGADIPVSRADIPRPLPPPARPEPLPSVTLPALPAESDAGNLVAVSPEERATAAGQFDRACEVRDAGNEEYALELLLSCCTIDPGNLFYRQTLRQVSATLTAQDRTGQRPGVLSALATWTRLKAAQRRHDYRRVLEYGEVLLLRKPRDVGTQLDLAAAAEELGLNSVAIWMLDQARGQGLDNAGVLRRLALLYERLGQFGPAIAVWKRIREIDPTQVEAPRKINALSASETIARGGYNR